MSQFGLGGWQNGKGSQPIDWPFVAFFCFLVLVGLALTVLYAWLAGGPTFPWQQR